MLLLSTIGLCAATALAQTQVKMKTSLGDIELLLDEQKAPKTVANFVKYAEKGFYNDTIFHRVIPGFMIQGGGFTENMEQKETDKAIQNEAGNGLKNQVGSIAMARTNRPDSATSQFFINVANNDFLNHTSNTPQGMGYAVFGRVSKGMEVVNRIAQVPTTAYQMHQDVPQKPIKILKVTIIQKDKKWFNYTPTLALFHLN